MRASACAAVLLGGCVWGAEPPSSEKAADADPRKVAAMDRALWDRSDTNAPVRAALFFAERDDKASLDRMRKCLAYLPQPGDDEHGPLSTKLTSNSDVRRIAVGALARRKDRESFEAILKMVGGDPSIRVRTAAAAAMGEYADPRAVPALVRALGQKDEGFSAEGHTDGDLRRAAVRSLGRIGNDEALAALYDQLAGLPAKSQSAEFWFTRPDPKLLAAFLKLYDARPINADFAAGVIESLARLEDGKKPTPAEQAAAEAEFLKGVDDPARFGPTADLTQKGKYTVRTTFTIHRDGFVTAHFAFRPAGGKGFGHGDGVLYRKTGERWRPVGRVGGWVE